MSVERICQSLSLVNIPTPDKQKTRYAMLHRPTDAEAVRRVRSEERSIYTAGLRSVGKCHVHFAICGNNSRKRQNSTTSTAACFQDSLHLSYRQTEITTNIGKGHLGEACSLLNRLWASRNKIIVVDFEGYALVTTHLTGGYANRVSDTS